MFFILSCIISINGKVVQTNLKNSTSYIKKKKNIKIQAGSHFKNPQKKKQNKKNQALHESSFLLNHIL